MASSIPVNTVVRERAQLLFFWLQKPLVRLLVPAVIIEAINMLREHAFRTTHALDHAVTVPPIGSVVQLLSYDSYLHSRVGAVPGSTGIVVGHSKQTPFDNAGLHVDWKDGHSIRVNLDEVAVLSVPSNRAPRERRPAPIGHLKHRPAIGSDVRLLIEDHTLGKHHGALLGATGSVVAHSNNRFDDTGVIVDWGVGGPIRCDLEELASV